MSVPTAIRIVLAVAAYNTYFVNSSDIKTAFLAAPLEERIYLEPPEGVNELDGQVWELNKSLYGLLQSSRNFWHMLAEKLYEYGFEAITVNKCSFIYREGEEVLIILTVVYDLIEVGNSRPLLKRVLAYLKEHFNLKDEGKLKWFLGVSYQQHTDWSITANQTAYIDKHLHRFKLQDMNVKETPMAVGLDLHAPDTKANPEGEQVEEVQADAHTCTYYRALIGSLLYTSVWL
eukprot:719392-Rhodomonas_salina.2